MGIKDINPFLKAFHSKVNHTVPLEVSLPLSDLKGCKIAIDANIIFFKYKTIAVATALKSFEDTIYDDELTESIYDDKTYYVKYDVYYKKLKTLFKTFLDSLLRLSVEPIFIFDGCSFSDAKKNFAHKRRNEQKKIILGKLTNAIKNKNSWETLKYLKQHISVSQEDRDLVYSILGDYAMFSKDEEAEQLCVKKYKNREVDYLYTCDTDVYIYNIDYVINSISLKDGTFTVFNIEEAKKCIKLNETSFRHFCILLECDYNKRIPKLGPQTAYKYIVQYGTIPKMMESLPNLNWEFLNFKVCEELFSLGVKSIECKIDEI